MSVGGRAGRARFFAQFILSAANGLRMTANGLCRNSTHKSFKFSIACAVILSPHFRRRTPEVYSVRQPPANCRGPPLRSAETRCVSHFDSPSRHCHPESRFFRDEGSAFVFVTENPCRSFAAAQDDSLGDCFSSSSFCPSWTAGKAVNAQDNSGGHWFSLSSFCPSWAAERLSMLRMTARGIGSPCRVSAHHGQPKGCQCSG